MLVTWEKAIGCWNFITYKLPGLNRIEYFLFYAHPILGFCVLLPSQLHHSAHISISTCLHLSCNGIVWCELPVPSLLPTSQNFLALWSLLGGILVDYILLGFISKSRIFQQTQSHIFPGSTLVEQNPCLVLVTQIKILQLGLGLIGLPWVIYPSLKQAGLDHRCCLAQV